ncbi:MAG: GAF domain-containing protein [Bacteroidales bacterium]
MKKVRLSIAARIGLGFGIIILAVSINGYLTNKTLSNSEEKNQLITSVYTPSVSLLNSMYEQVNNSLMLIRSWVFIDKLPDTEDKTILRELHAETVPVLDEEIREIYSAWDTTDQKTYDRIYAAIADTLFPMHKYIMEQLSSFESYDNPMVVFEIIPMVEEGGEIILLTQKILKDLEAITNKHEQVVNEARVEMDQSFANFRQFIFLMTLALFISSIIIALVVTRSLARPINSIKRILLNMAKGILPKDKMPEGKDEIGQMSLALNNLVKGLNDISNFASEIGKGNFNSEFTPLSDQDILGNSLINMREELRNAALEEEKRKKEDEQRNWATQGLARFGEILRQNNDNLEELSYNIISNLVKYMDANQGGLFIVNNNDENNVFIELNACYAFNRKKFLEKRIEIGEGLVGRCVQEGETIYMTDIPNDYIRITSGLGDENPRSLLIVPLKLNEEIYGVIEVASFKDFESYQVEFVEKIGESIASTISSVKINIQTSLLLEQTQQQAEEMSSQEEEMRQNMEELRATQEQTARREADLQRELDECRKKVQRYEED